jgi:hypothetical protein
MQDRTASQSLKGHRYDFSKLGCVLLSEQREMSMSILCKLGWHRWEYHPIKEDRKKWTLTFPASKCKKCHKKKEGMVLDLKDNKVRRALGMFEIE